MLYVVATPIGDTNEITLRALEVLKDCENIICESTKEASKLLKLHGITGKKYFLLNEHTEAKDYPELVSLCLKNEVALVSDCGTPGFCDPGAELIRLCRAQNITIKSVLGASALMGLLSLVSQKVNQFVFRGFLSPETEERRAEWLELRKEKRAIVLMDTPYRMKKIVAEVAEHVKDRKVLMVLNLSAAEEVTIECKGWELPQKITSEKAEFMTLIYPE